MKIQNEPTLNIQTCLKFAIKISCVFICIYSSAVFAQSGSWSGGSVVDRDAIWARTTIPVCWEVQSYNYLTEKEWVRSAIARSWEENSGLKFTGWGTCRDNNDGMRIQIDETWPRVKNFGKFIDGVKNGIQLNFTFQGEFKCYRSRQDCIEIIAIHEFGHALGFHHEQNRSDTDTSSKCYKEDYQGQVPNELMIGDWDLASVMNYCNPKWSGNGELSNGDIQGVQQLYGKPTPPTPPTPHHHQHQHQHQHQHHQCHRKILSHALFKVNLYISICKIGFFRRRVGKC